MLHGAILILSIAITRYAAGVLAAACLYISIYTLPLISYTDKSSLKHRRAPVMADRRPGPIYSVECDAYCHGLFDLSGCQPSFRRRPLLIFDECSAELFVLISLS